MSRKYKLVLLGEGCVGKTSLMTRFVKGVFDSKIKSTVQVSYHERSLNIDGSKLTFVVYDTAGQERFHSLAPLYYRDAKGIILVYDVTDMDSFKKVEKWLKEIKKFCNVTNPKIIILGNKKDLATNRRVDNKRAADYAKKLGVLFLEVSAKSGSNVNQAFLMLAKAFLKDKSSTSSHNIPNYSNNRRGLKIEDDFDNNSSSSSPGPGACCGSQ